MFFINEDKVFRRHFEHAFGEGEKFTGIFGGFPGKSG